MPTEARRSGTGEVTQKELKRIISEFERIPKEVTYHVVDPAEFAHLTGKIEFREPVPIRNTLQMHVFDRKLSIFVNTDKLFLKSIEFFDDPFQKVVAIFEVRRPESKPMDVKFNYATYVEGLTLLYHDEVYRAYREGRAEISPPDFKEFLQLLDELVNTVSQSQEANMFSAQELFREYHRNSGVGDSFIFNYGDWRRFEIITDWGGTPYIEFVGLTNIDGHPYLVLYDTSLSPVDVVGIESTWHASYRIKLSTLAKLPIAGVIKSLYEDGKRVLNKYIEQTKYMFLGVKAYAT